MRLLPLLGRVFDSKIKVEAALPKNQLDSLRGYSPIHEFMYRPVTPVVSFAEESTNFIMGLATDIIRLGL